MQSIPSYPSYPSYVISLEDSTSAADPSTSISHSLADSSITKKQKIDRACDFCRRRKTKCDGPHVRDNVCTNCIQNRKPCTYVENSKPRGPPKAYVTGLEDRLEKMEALLKRLRPENDFSDVLGPPVIRDSWKNEPSIRFDTKSDANSSAVALGNRPDLSYSQSTGSIPTTFPYRHLVANGTPSAGYRLDAQASGSSHYQLPTPSALKSVNRSRSMGRMHSYRDRPLTDDADNASSSEEYSSSDVSDSSTGWRGTRRLTRHGLQPPPNRSADLLIDETDDEPDDGLLNTQIRFFGKSSSFRFVGSAMKMKRMHLEDLKRQVKTEAGAEDECANQRRKLESAKASSALRHRRQFWVTPPWEHEWERLHHTSLSQLPPAASTPMPRSDLARNLINLYFSHVNSEFPLLHRPTFERQYSSGLYHHDLWFRCLCMSLFAVASRWCNDPEVLSENSRYIQDELVKDETPEDKKWRTSGWKYYDAAMAIYISKRGVIHVACLFEVQVCSLLPMFLRGSRFFPSSWVMVGWGIRKAQDVGVHRKKAYGSQPTVEKELWKRAWWLLVAFDWIGSIALGRPCLTREEDFDVDLPLEVDDEYWESDRPELAFKQPSGKPPLVAAFNAWLRLTQIKAFALRTLYCIDKSKVLLGLVGPRWRERIVTQMNDALTEWVESVPSHLRWSPNMPDQIFANQSATLYTTYYLCQILIYRPFIPAPSSDTSYHDKLPFSALSVCTNAARAIARIIDLQLQRGISNIPVLTACCHIGAALLLISVWDLKARNMSQGQAVSGADVKPHVERIVEEYLADVDKLMRALRYAALRWEGAALHLKHLGDSLPSTPTSTPPPEPPRHRTEAKYPYQALNSYDRTPAERSSLRDGGGEPAVNYHWLQPPSRENPLFYQPPQSGLQWFKSSATHSQDVQTTPTAMGRLRTSYQGLEDADRRQWAADSSRSYYQPSPPPPQPPQVQTLYMRAPSMPTRPVLPISQTRRMSSSSHSALESPAYVPQPEAAWRTVQQDYAYRSCPTPHDSQNGSPIPARTTRHERDTDDQYPLSAPPAVPPYSFRVDEKYVFRRS